MSRRSHIKTESARTFQTLDPCTLGRPTHLLGRFSATAQERLAHFFDTRLNPRYGTSFEVGPVTFATRGGALPFAELPGGTAATAGIAAALERPVLLRILECRYGRHGVDSAQEDGRPVKPHAATASERRIAAQLGAELRELLAECIGRDERQVAASPGAPPAHRTQTDLSFACRIGDFTQGELGRLHFTLDAQWQARVFARLSSARSRAKREPGADLQARLPLTLAVRLMETGMPLDALLKLRAGAVIPVQLGTRAQVLAGATPLFTAQVAEDNGRLCLTAFEDME
ncbi:FliM/FliN family flagellar motor C-terminal domain-containing protein [Trinickia mobilis]|uniref:FliM/FliN family flagellar motor C-terminal domain-containing protein n=1 Tax=Trinickia mobilis TaxID=2816356 RepID=UPI001A8F2F8A|nr:FliM/FliN family flagellar motor C-terminal domain-containing protein [Trinickia mobilis]